MSILNAWIHTERAYVGVDTSAAGPGASKMVSKMTPIVHINAVLACRGNVPFFGLLSQVCLFVPDTFDDLVDRMAELATQNDVNISRLEQIHGVPSAPYSAPEIICVGWSARRGRMTGVSCKKHGDSFVSEVLDPGWSSIAPYDHDFPDPPCVYDPQQIASYVQVQAEIARRKCPDGSIGGKFIIARVEAQGMTIAPLCEIP